MIFNDRNAECRTEAGVELKIIEIVGRFMKKLQCVGGRDIGTFMQADRLYRPKAGTRVLKSSVVVTDKVDVVKEPRTDNAVPVGIGMAHAVQGIEPFGKERQYIIVKCAQLQMYLGQVGFTPGIGNNTGNKRIFMHQGGAWDA